MPRFFPLFLFLCLFLLIPTSAHGGHDEDADNDPPSAGDNPNLRSKALILVKIWCLLLIFIGTFVAGVSPYFLKWNEGFLLLGTQFAGGIFLGTALMHFLSDANETFRDLTEKEYPFAFMLASFGYLITMSVDVLIHYLHAKHKHNLADSHSPPSGGCKGDVVQLEQGQQAVLDAGRKSIASVADTLLLIIALCFHSVFEGIAIGVAETKADAWKALWTISLHKVFAAIAMGIALLRMLPNRPLLSCAAYAFAFAISSPIGVAIGIVIDATTQGSVADWIFAISMSLACGVFIFVTINHLISKGYTPHRDVSVDKPHLRFLAVLLGVGVIAVVMIWDT